MPCLQIQDPLGRVLPGRQRDDLRAPGEVRPRQNHPGCVSWGFPWLSPSFPFVQGDFPRPRKTKLLPRTGEDAATELPGKGGREGLSSSSPRGLS